MGRAGGDDTRHGDGKRIPSPGEVGRRPVHKTWGASVGLYSRGKNVGPHHREGKECSR